jgi:hypothetical protein
MSPLYSSRKHWVQALRLRLLSRAVALSRNDPRRPPWDARCPEWLRERRQAQLRRRSAGGLPKGLARAGAPSRYVNTLNELEALGEGSSLEGRPGGLGTNPDAKRQAPSYMRNDDVDGPAPATRTFRWAEEIRKKAEAGRVASLCHGVFAWEPGERSQ